LIVSTQEGGCHVTLVDYAHDRGQWRDLRLVVPLIESERAGANPALVFSEVAMLPVVFTVREVAKALRVSQAVIYGYVEAGLLVCHRLGARGRGAIRITEAQVEALLELRKTQKGPKPVKPSAPRRKLKLQHLSLPT
jgi:excisionase family DNA binding protein